MTSTEHTDIPTEVTMREVRELLRTFEAAGWASLDLTIGDMHIVLGRDAAPNGVAPAPAPAPARESAALTTAPAAPASVEVSAPVEVSTPPVTPTPAPSTPALEPMTGLPPSENAVKVTAPVVGTFWVSPAPGQPPFIEVGQTVAAGQQLGIVEIMKLMSDISSPVAGTVVQILAKNAAMVEFDEVLVVIEPSDD